MFTCELLSGNGYYFHPTISDNILNGYYYLIFFIAGSVGVELYDALKFLNKIDNIIFLDFGFYDYSEIELEKLVSTFNRKWKFITRDSVAFGILNSYGFNSFNSYELAFNLNSIIEFSSESCNKTKKLDLNEQIKTTFLFGFPVVVMDVISDLKGYSIVNIDPITTRNTIISNTISNKLSNPLNRVIKISNSTIDSNENSLFISKTDERIRHLAYSNLIITNRLHNVVIAIIYSVPFIFYSRNNKFDDGRNSFLKRVGLDLIPNRLYTVDEIIEVRKNIHLTKVDLDIFMNGLLELS